MPSCFPALVDQHPPRPEYAIRPIGRRRYLQPRRRSGGAGLAGLAIKLAELARAVEAQTALLLDIGAVLEQVASELRATAHQRRQLNEKLDLLLRSQTGTRRQLGQTALHVPSRHSRQQPLGHD